MRIYGINDAVPSKNGAVMAIGFFDGVHLGHRALISRATDYAKERGLEVGVFTFSSEGGIKAGTPRIYTTRERLDIIEALGVDFAVVADLSEVAELTAREFVEQILARGSGAVCAAVGYNFRFGKGASAGASELRKIMSELSLDTIVCDAEKYLGEPISSSIIRKGIESGDMPRVCELLGAPYFISGVVEYGRGVGTSYLGFPTVNIALREGGVVPRRGVYRGALTVENNVYSAVANIGVCPTFDPRVAHVEVHIIDFSGDIYGNEVKLYLLGFLRDEQRFSDINELKMQINIDKSRAKQENGDIKWITAGLN